MGAEGQVELRFSGHVVQTGNHVNLSAIRTEGEYLWLAGDETATVERLTLDSALAPTVGDRQRSFALADLVDLPGPPHAEADLEGLARSAAGCGSPAPTAWSAGGSNPTTPRARRSAASPGYVASRTGS